MNVKTLNAKIDEFVSNTMSFMLQRELKLKCSILGTNVLKIPTVILT